MRLTREERPVDMGRGMIAVGPVTEPVSLHRNVRRALDEVLDAVVVCVAVREPDGGIVDLRVDYRNPAAVDVVGRLRESFVGESVLAAFPPRSRRRLLGRFARVVESGEPMIQMGLPYERVVGGQKVRRVYDIRTAKF